MYARLCYHVQQRMHAIIALCQWWMNFMTIMHCWSLIELQAMRLSYIFEVFSLCLLCARVLCCKSLSAHTHISYIDACVRVCVQIQGVMKIATNIDDISKESSFAVLEDARVMWVDRLGLYIYVKVKPHSASIN